LLIPSNGPGHLRICDIGSNGSTFPLDA